MKKDDIPDAPRTPRMDDPFAKLRFDPETRAVIEEVTARLVEAGVVERDLDAAHRFVRTLDAVLIASSMVPLHIRCFFAILRPVRVWRIRRALRPMRASIRSRLALPDLNKPWLEDYEAFRFILHGF